MNINDALFMYWNAADIAKKYTDSKEGIRWEHFRRKLNSIAIELDYYDDKNGCSEQNFGHLKLCRSHLNETFLGESGSIQLLWIMTVRSSDVDAS
jgi:hypothetical protein